MSLNHCSVGTSINKYIEMSQEEENDVCYRCFKNFPGSPSKEVVTISDYLQNADLLLTKQQCCL